MPPFKAFVPIYKFGYVYTYCLKGDILKGEQNLSLYNTY